MSRCILSPAPSPGAASYHRAGPNQAGRRRRRRRARDSEQPSPRSPHAALRIYGTDYIYGTNYAVLHIARCSSHPQEGGPVRGDLVRVRAGVCDLGLRGGWRRGRDHRRVCHRGRRGGKAVRQPGRRRCGVPDRRRRTPVPQPATRRPQPGHQACRQDLVLRRLPDRGRRGHVPYRGGARDGHRGKRPSSLEPAPGVRHQQGEPEHRRPADDLARRLAVLCRDQRAHGAARDDQLPRGALPHAEAGAPRVPVL